MWRVHARGVSVTNAVLWWSCDVNICIGEYRDSTTYPLADRSLRLVVGRNADEAASDSNGSGKTTLVMAPLWALTGRSDARAEVSHDSSLFIHAFLSNVISASCVFSVDMIGLFCLVMAAARPTLVMAPLWAITGRSDARAEASRKSLSVHCDVHSF